MTIELEALRRQIAEGILVFPATPFRPDGALDPGGLEAHVAFLVQQRPSALVAAGGAGEFFSLSLEEQKKVVQATVRHSAGVPVIAGVGYGAAIACELARSAEQAGAAAVMLLPPYLVRAEQEGLFHHIRAVCEATAIGVMPYSRDNGVIEPDTLLRLADRCPNLIGVKDGTGDLEALLSLKVRAGERLTVVNGVPTAEVLAMQARAIGVMSYSSAVFTFLPALARRFYEAVSRQDTDYANAMLRKFYFPLVELRRRKRGYAVSLVKAGLRVVGKPAGPVRPPLMDLEPEEEAILAGLITEAEEWSA